MLKRQIKTMGQHISLICYRLPKHIKNLIIRVEKHLDYISNPRNLDFTQENKKRIIKSNKILISQLETNFTIIPPKYEDFIKEAPPRFEEIDNPIFNIQINANDIKEDEFIEYMEACVEYFQICIE